MAKCTVCSGGGAKRSCPALGGSICPSCCATQQRRTISCVESCSYLRPLDSQDGYQTGVKKLLDFAMSSRPRARSAIETLARSAEEIPEWEQPLVMAYLAYGYADESGLRTIDVFLRDGQAQLKVTEREALAALAKTGWPSLFEVEQVELDVGIGFKDLVTGETIFACEKTGTHYFKKFDLMFGWLVELGNHVEMTGAGVSVPREHREVVLKALNKEMRRLRKGSDDPDRVLLRRSVAAGQRALRDAIERWQPPRMVNRDGEDIAMCEAYFHVKDVAAARERFASAPEFEPRDDTYGWIDREASSGDEVVVMGVVRLEGKVLVFETNSRERLARGKQRLSKLLAGVGSHRADSIKDLSTALDEAESDPTPSQQDELPEDVQAEILVPIMQKHIESWIDEPLPALNGKTPRQVAATKSGRTKVENMLKDQQNSMLRQPGGDQVNFSVVYRALGLPLP